MTADRAAVLELRTVGVPAAVVARMRRAIGRAIRRATDLEVVDDDHVDRAAAALASCAQPREPASQPAASEGEATDDGATGLERQDRCALEVGARLGASQVVVTAVGGLGKTFIVQLRVLDVGKAAVTRSLEETRFGGVTVLPATAGQLAVRLFGSTGRARVAPWYTRWWVWTAVAAAASAAVAIPLVVNARASEPYEDVPLP